MKFEVGMAPWLAVPYENMVAPACWYNEANMNQASQMDEFYTAQSEH